MLHSWLVHSSMNCTRSSTTELSDQLTLHSSEIGGKSLTLYTDYSVTTLIGGSVTNHAGRYPRRCTQECVRHEGFRPCHFSTKLLGVTDVSNRSSVPPLPAAISRLNDRGRVAKFAIARGYLGVARRTRFPHAIQRRSAFTLLNPDRLRGIFAIWGCVPPSTARRFPA